MSHRFEVAAMTPVNPHTTHSTSHRASHERSRLAALLSTMLLTLGLAAPPAQAADTSTAPGGFSAGINIQPSATADDIGLPIYPGARPVREGDDSEGASIRLWGGAFGIQLQVAKLQSPDNVDAVARYYREALSRYGQVLDCSTRVDPPAPEGTQQLRCDGDKPKRGERLFKVGTRKQFRVVSVEAAGSGSLVQLVRMEFRKD